MMIRYRGELHHGSVLHSPLTNVVFPFTASYNPRIEPR
jgi:hypothetical protein